MFSKCRIDKVNLGSVNLVKREREEEDKSEARLTRIKHLKNRSHILSREYVDKYIFVLSKYY